MLEQLSNPITFYAFYSASKVGKTGLTVSADIRRGSTSLASGSAATEIGGGLYSVTLSGTNTGTEGLYTCIFKTSDSTVDQRDLPALWAVGVAGLEYLDAAISSRAASGGTVTIASPVAQSGNATVRQGKDYASAISTALIWTLTNPPSPTPSSVLFTCRALNLSKACSYSSPTITLELTAAETAALAAGIYPFEIEATISGLKHPGLVAGTITVERDL
ncbi:MAG: hypothetical protein KF726_02515 [Anaerolineae bacterium]|nr:hypothetical protein [Anaerolineae bacterium]